MGVIDPRTGLRQLSAEECWTRLGEQEVGRVGVLVDGRPEVYPVNHAVDGRSVVFRTDPGSKLRGLANTPAVCFEVDGIDPVTATGWSVLVKGRADEVVAAEEVRRLAELPLRLWAGGHKVRWIRITPHEVTGRAVEAPA